MHNLNPLQYVPVVGMIYRAVSGETIPVPMAPKTPEWLESPTQFAAGPSRGTATYQQALLE